MVRERGISEEIPDEDSNDLDVECEQTIEVCIYRPSNVSFAKPLFSNSTEHKKAREKLISSVSLSKKTRGKMGLI